MIASISHQKCVYPNKFINNKLLLRHDSKRVNMPIYKSDLFQLLEVALLQTPSYHSPHWNIACVPNCFVHWCRCVCVGIWIAMEGTQVWRETSHWAAVALASHQVSSNSWHTKLQNVTNFSRNHDLGSRNDSGILLSPGAESKKPLSQTQTPG